VSDNNKKIGPALHWAGPSAGARKKKHAKRTQNSRFFSREHETATHTRYKKTGAESQSTHTIKTCREKDDDTAPRRPNVAILAGCVFLLCAIALSLSLSLFLYLFILNFLLFFSPPFLAFFLFFFLPFHLSIPFVTPPPPLSRMPLLSQLAHAGG